MRRFACVVGCGPVLECHSVTVAILGTGAPFWGATSVSTALMYICTAMKLWKQAAALSRNFTPANITRDTAANVVSLLAVV